MSPRTSTPPSPAAVARQRLADAEQAHAEVIAERSGYESALASLLQRQGAGTAHPDDDETEIRLRTAIGRCARLIEAKAREVATAHRLLVNEDDALGTAVAPVIQKALGVPVTVVTSKPDTPPTNLPAAYVVAAQPPTRNTIDGRVSGSVEFHWHRTPLHVQPNAKAIEGLADALGLAVEVIDINTRDEADHLVDVVKINVRRAHEPLPVVAYRAGMDDMFRVKWFASALAAEIADSMEGPSYTAPMAGVRLGSGDASAPCRRVQMPVTNATTVGDGCDGDGVRKRAVRVSVSVDTFVSEHVRDKMQRAIDAQIGKVHAGLGRVESVQMGAFNPASSGLNGHWVGGHIEATFTFVSKVAPGSDEVPTVKPTAATATPVQEPAADRGPRHPDFFLR